VLGDLAVAAGIPYLRRFAMSRFGRPGSGDTTAL
jgi:hypothetical protein